MRKCQHLSTLFTVGFFALLALSAWIAILTVDLERQLNQQSYAEVWSGRGIPALPHDRALVTTFASRVDGFIRDNFGFRDSYFQILAKLCSWMGVIPDSYTMIRGRENWFFVTDDRALEAYTPRFYLTAPEVERWHAYIEAKRRWATSIGAHYFFMMAPNSSTVYHDKLPLLDGIDVMQSHMTQIFGSVQQSADAPFMIDPRAALFLARKESPHNLYYKTDAHWNFIGAERSFRVLMSSVQQAFPTLQVDQYQDARFRVTNRSAMGHVQHFSAGEELHDYDVEISDLPECTRIEHFQSLPNPYRLGELREPLKTICPSAHPLKVLVFHDSFFKYLQPMLSAQFQEVSYIWLYTNSDEVNRFYAELLKPDIIIEEVAERYSRAFRDTTLDPRH